ncbi:hypothetical protein SESBI_46759 [Sesbania bispinosa]|nr:hypothetical protein SESBI_46759 [Sesbania bispinosa]
MVILLSGMLTGRVWGVDGSVDDCVALCLSPPLSGFFKLNVDGCFNILDGFMGIGGWGSSRFRWSLALGVFCSVCSRERFGGRAASLEGWFRNHMGEKSSVLEIRDLLSRPWDVRLVHVLREANCLADHMSRLTNYRDGRVQLWDTPPHDALIFLPADCHS